MAHLSDRFEENVPGPFYVESGCIDCDQCRDKAPAFFTRNDDIGASIVHRQPVTPDELELCLETLGICPVEAIGRDG